MKSFFKYLLVLLSGFFILFLSIFIFFLIISDTEPIVDDNSYLVMNISGGLPEYVAPDPFEEFTGRSPMDLRKIRENLEKAAVDERINGVVFNLGFIQTGYAKINELHKLIDTYKQSGKKIYAFMEFGVTKSYLVATACDSIFMPESSNLFITGLGAGVMYFKGLFDKIGIEADFVHIGKHKDAPNSFTDDKMPQDQRMVLDDLLDQFYDTVVNTISQKRGIPKTEILDLINNTSGFTADSAVNAGLIDATLYENELADLFNYNNATPKKLNGATYAAVPISSLDIRNKSRIAVIHVSGTIASGNDVNDPIMGKLAGASTIVDDINSAAESRSTKAIIIRIDSPGGSAIAADQIWKAITTAAEIKPVIASISDYGASGGYYIAMAADTILNNPMSIVGSIGVFSGKFSTEKLYKKIGLNEEILLRGKNAALFSTNSLWSESERAVIQRLMEEFYKSFVTKVAASRNMTYEQADKVAQGRVWTGKQGLDKGLIDISGTFYDAVELAKQMAGIERDESVRLSYYPKEKGFFTELYNLVSVRFNKFELIRENELTFITKFQNKPLALLPYVLEWN